MAAEGRGSMTGQSSSEHQGQDEAPWQQQLQGVLSRVRMQPLSPGGSPALLLACSELQSLLDTAADWGTLNQWLAAVPAPPAGVGVSGGEEVVAHVDVREQLLTSLVRLVDSRTPDVLVKVGKKYD